MENIPSILYILSSFLILFVIYIIIIYNKLISRKNKVKSVFSTVEAILQKRYDLIPNLVSTVKGYMKHEQNILTEIAELREKGKKIEGSEKIGIEQKITADLNLINLRVENYPNLKANKNFLQLQRDLANIENKLSAGRRAYNAMVREYNTYYESFPIFLFAPLLGFKKMDFFMSEKIESK